MSRVSESPFRIASEDDDWEKLLWQAFASGRFRATRTSGARPGCPADEPRGDRVTKAGLAGLGGMQVAR
jgi:hypothetical protein